MKTILIGRLFGLFYNGLSCRERNCLRDLHLLVYNERLDGKDDVVFGVEDLLFLEGS